MTQFDFSVIDQMFSAQLSMNQSKEDMDALRPKVKEAIRELLRQEGKPADFTGVITYHGIRIRVQRPHILHLGAQHPAQGREPRLLQATARDVRAAAGRSEGSPPRHEAHRRETRQSTPEQREYQARYDRGVPVVQILKEYGFDGFTRKRIIIRINP